MPATTGMAIRKSRWPSGEKGNARTLPLEEGHSELVLERAHQLRDGRLAEEDVLGRPRDALQPGRVTEGAELLQPVASDGGRPAFQVGSNGLLRWKICFKSKYILHLPPPIAIPLEHDDRGFRNINYVIS